MQSTIDLGENLKTGAQNHQEKQSDQMNRTPHAQKSSPAAKPPGNPFIAHHCPPSTHFTLCASGLGRPALARRVENGTTCMMNLKPSLALVLILLAPCLATGARAMPILDFARLNNDDEATYVTLLVEGSAAMFKAHGQPDQARKIILFFKVPGKDGGVYRFADQLKKVDALNNKNAINPNNRAPVYQVEDAMAATLKNEGFIVPVSYLLTLGNDFQPAGPPRSHQLDPGDYHGN
jgi:hypothetical protein